MRKAPLPRVGAAVPFRFEDSRPGEGREQCSEHVVRDVVAKKRERFSEKVLKVVNGVIKIGEQVGRGLRFQRQRAESRDQKDLPPTQIGRALAAHSPQSKERVERSFPN